VTTDITTKGGQFDIMTIGMYETPIWGANGWLCRLMIFPKLRCRRHPAGDALAA
jgi:sorbitol/mannitol transport system substrate-binding protein